MKRNHTIIEIGGELRHETEKALNQPQKGQPT